MLRKCEGTLKNVFLFRTIWSRTIRVFPDTNTWSKFVIFRIFSRDLRSSNNNVETFSSCISQFWWCVRGSVEASGVNERRRRREKKLPAAYHKVFIFFFSQKSRWRVYATLIQRRRRQNLILCQVGMVPILIVIHLGQPVCLKKWKNFVN